MRKSANQENVLLSSMPADNGEIRVFLWDGKILLESETGDRTGQVVLTGEGRTVTMELSPNTAGILVAILQVGMAALARKTIEGAMRTQGIIP